MSFNRTDTASNIIAAVFSAITIFLLVITLVATGESRASENVKEYGTLEDVSNRIEITDTDPDRAQEREDKNNDEAYYNEAKDNNPYKGDYTVHIEVGRDFADFTGDTYSDGYIVLVDSDDTDNTVSLPKVIAKDGYTFIGWSTGGVRFPDVEMTVNQISVYKDASTNANALNLFAMFIDDQGNGYCACGDYTANFFAGWVDTYKAAYADYLRTFNGVDGSAGFSVGIAEMVFLCILVLIVMVGINVAIVLVTTRGRRSAAGTGAGDAASAGGSAGVGVGGSAGSGTGNGIDTDMDTAGNADGNADATCMDTESDEMSAEAEGEVDDEDGDKTADTDVVNINGSMDNHKDSAE